MFKAADKVFYLQREYMNKQEKQGKLVKFGVRQAVQEFKND